MSSKAEKDNVSQSELKKFAATAGSWWDPEGPFKPLHQLNPVRLGYVQQKTCLAGIRVADLGCGGGLLSEAMARAGAGVVALDMSREALTVARLHAAETGVKVDYRQMTAEALEAAEPETFDLVTCMEMLEHVPDPGRVVKAAAGLAKPGAKLVFSTINRNFRAWLFAIAGAEYLAGMLPKGTHEYQQLIRPSELARTCRHAGLEVEEVAGMRLNLLQNRWSLTKDARVNYLLSAVKPAAG